MISVIAVCKATHYRDARANTLAQQPNVSRIRHQLNRRGCIMQQTGKIAFGAAIVLVTLVFAYAEVRADAALITERGVASETNILEAQQAE